MAESAYLLTPMTRAHLSNTGRYTGASAACAQGLSASTAGTATVKTAFQTAYITTPGPQRTNWMPGDRPQAPFTRLRHSSPEPLPDARNLRQMLKVTIARE